MKMSTRCTRGPVSYWTSCVATFALSIVVVVVVVVGQHVSSDDNVTSLDDFNVWFGARSSLEDTSISTLWTSDDSATANSTETSPTNRSDATGRTKRSFGCPVSRYRSYNGHCNNLLFSKWGSARKPYARLLLPFYSDGKGKPRIFGRDGSPLPCARCLSLRLAHDVHRDYPLYTHMLMQWGQFLNHDLTNKPVWTDDVGNEISCCGPESMDNPECFPIEVPMDDPFYARYGNRCMNFVRSKPYDGRDYITAFREQYNDNTAFIDGSNIYGSTHAGAVSLRTYMGGRLKVTHMDGHKDLLPADHGGMCRVAMCFKAGDFRANMFPSLTSMHTVWMREHNRIVETLQQLNPQWDDERLYQEGRKIVGAEIQHITYREFLPILLGEDGLARANLELHAHGHFEGYDFNVNPTITNAFTTAAFRFGHSLIQAQFKRYYMNNVEAPWSPWLGDEYFNSTCLYRGGEMDELLLGLVNQHSQITDPFFTTEITTRLYEPGVLGSGQDLVAINIQRGRDNGIAPYNMWREYCGLRKVRDFDELRHYMNPYSVDIFRNLYRSVDDIDLFPAGVSETHADSAGILGPTFACIVSKQFHRLRVGDRFWYENNPVHGQVIFTKSQLEELRKTSLASVLCDNSEGIEHIQPMVMHIPKDWNSRRYCGDDSIPRMDLSKWREEYTEPYFVVNNDIYPSPPHGN